LPSGRWHCCFCYSGFFMTTERNASRILSDLRKLLNINALMRPPVDCTAGVQLPRCSGVPQQKPRPIFHGPDISAIPLSSFGPHISKIFQLRLAVYIEGTQSLAMMVSSTLKSLCRKYGSDISGWPMSFSCVSQELGPYDKGCGYI
jgi:hypothetical protein